MYPVSEPTGEQKYLFWVEDSLVKVLEDQPMSDDASKKVNLHAARGEYEAAQIAIRPTENFIARMRVECSPLKRRGGGGELPAPRSRFVDSVPVRSNSGSTPPEHLVAKAPAWIPEVLYDVSDVDVWPNKTRCIWLTFQIPASAEPGVYTGKVRIYANKAVIAVPVSVRVHDVTVPAKGKLRITNWVKLDNIARWHGCRMFDERFWEVVRIYAENMAAHRHNVIFTPMSIFFTKEKLIGISAKGKKLHFDFSNFDHWVETFIEAGVVGTIEGGHIGGGGSVHCWIPRGGEVVYERHPADSPEAEAYLSQFFAALQAHLDRKGWTDIYCQHLMDEPSSEWKDVYNAAARCGSIPAAGRRGLMPIAS